MTKLKKLILLLLCLTIFPSLILIVGCEDSELESSIIIEKRYTPEQPVYGVVYDPVFEPFPGYYIEPEHWELKLRLEYANGSKDTKWVCVDKETWYSVEVGDEYFHRR